MSTVASFSSLNDEPCSSGNSVSNTNVGESASAHCDAPTSDDDTELMECSICMQEYQRPDCIPILLPCGHAFCRACLVAYREPRCPNCRDYRKVPSTELCVFTQLLDTNEQINEMLKKTAAPKELGKKHKEYESLLEEVRKTQAEVTGLAKIRNEKRTKLAELEEKFAQALIDRDEISLWAEEYELVDEEVKAREAKMQEAKRYELKLRAELEYGDVWVRAMNRSLAEHKASSKLNHLVAGVMKAGQDLQSISEKIIDKCAQRRD